MAKTIREIRNSSVTNFLVQMLIGRATTLDFLCEKGVISKNYYYDSLTALVLRKVLKTVSTCVDVGCHQGDILQMMIKYAPHGKFYAFEPLPHLFNYLKKKYGSIQGISTYNLALSDTVGVSSFNYVLSNPGYSGLIKRRYDRPDEKDMSITVKTDSMDHLLGNTSIDLIKIDVEGAELQVLRGARDIIKKDKPYIIFEHGLGASDCYGTKPEDVYELLSGYCGLSLNLLNRYLRGMKPLSRLEFCEQFYHGRNYFFLAYKA